MTIWDILKDATIVVAHDPWVIAWNYSATFNVYEETGPGQWTEVDAFTSYDVATVKEARALAREHMIEIWAAA